MHDRADQVKSIFLDAMDKHWANNCALSWSELVTPTRCSAPAEGSAFDFPVYPYARGYRIVRLPSECRE
jgi:hypothetical protein